MPKMSDRQLIAILNAGEEDAAIFNGEFSKENERYLKGYLGRPYGDEVEDQSQVVSTDIADVVDADMASLARVFMGSGDIITFDNVVFTINEVAGNKIETITLKQIKEEE